MFAKNVISTHTKNKLYCTFRDKKTSYTYRRNPNKCM